jgi:pimeloyl-ACP methyl ester carboxylesterase
MAGDMHQGYANERQITATVSDATKSRMVDSGERRLLLTCSGDLLSSTARARDIATLGSIPVHVITSGVFLNQAIVPQEHRAALQERWEDLQQRFLKLSSRAPYLVARSSGHFIQRDDPRAVLAVIRAAIAQARCAPGVPAVGG